MITGAGSLSANTVQLLFGNNKAANTTETGAAATLPGAITVQPENASRAGAAIGKIIEIVAGMNKADNLSTTNTARPAPAVQQDPVSGAQAGEAGAKPDDGLFTMEGAKRIDGANGEYRLVKTGTGKFTSREGPSEATLERARERAAGVGPKAERARAYLDALENGTIERVDLSTKGVTSTYTQTMYYYADGTQKGVTGSWTTTGLDEFREAHMYTDEDGISRDKATGKYAVTTQNGTHFSYVTY